jgi:hypothetical protein
MSSKKPLQHFSRTTVPLQLLIGVIISSLQATDLKNRPIQNDLSKFTTRGITLRDFVKLYRATVAHISRRILAWANMDRSGYKAYKQALR